MMSESGAGPGLPIGVLRYHYEMKGKLGQHALSLLIETTSCCRGTVPEIWSARDFYAADFYIAGLLHAREQEV